MNRYFIYFILICFAFGCQTARQNEFSANALPNRNRVKWKQFELAQGADSVAMTDASGQGRWISKDSLIADIVVDSIGELKLYPKEEEAVFLKGFKDIDDGGGGYFYYDPTAFVEDTFKYVSATFGGTWVRYIENRDIYPEMIGGASPSTEDIQKTINYALSNEYNVRGKQTYLIDETLYAIDGYQNISINLFNNDGANIDTMLVLDPVFLENVVYDISLDGNRDNNSHVVGVLVNDIKANKADLNISAKRCDKGIILSGNNETFVMNVNGSNCDTLVSVEQDFSNLTLTPDQLVLNITGTDCGVFLKTDQQKSTGVVNINVEAAPTAGVYAIDLEGGFWDINGEIRGSSGGIRGREQLAYLGLNVTMFSSNTGGDRPILISSPNTRISGRASVSGFSNGVLIDECFEGSSLELNYIDDLLVGADYGITLGDVNSVFGFTLTGSIENGSTGGAIYLKNCSQSIISPTFIASGLVKIDNGSEFNRVVINRNSALNCLYEDNAINNNWFFSGKYINANIVTILSNFTNIHERVCLELDSNDVPSCYSSVSSNFRAITSPWNEETNGLSYSSGNISIENSYDDKTLSVGSSTGGANEIELNFPFNQTGNISLSRGGGRTEIFKISGFGSGQGVTTNSTKITGVSGVDILSFDPTGIIRVNDAYNLPNTAPNDLEILSRNGANVGWNTLSSLTTSYIDGSANDAYITSNRNLSIGGATSSNLSLSITDNSTTGLSGSGIEIIRNEASTAGNHIGTTFKSLGGSTEGSYGFENTGQNGHANFYISTRDAGGFNTFGKAFEVQLDGDVKSLSDLHISDAAKGLVLTSPDGSCWRITIDNTGVLSTTSITCP